MTVTPSAPDRRLLLNGERLRVQVEPSNSGGGTKFEPFTAIEAREFILPQITAARSTASGLAADERAEGRIYVEAQLLPNYISASDFPEDLLNQIDAVPVGSRLATGQYQTKAKVREASTRRLILSVSDTGLAELEALVTAGGGATRSERGAFEDIRKLSEFAIPTAEERVAAPLEGVAEPRLCEAVLHPSSSVNGEPVPIDEDTYARWLAFVESRGGEVVEPYVRQVGGLTFTPVYVLPSELINIARFNPLRGIRPMPAIRPRPGAMTRAGAQLIPPVSPATTAPEPRVAVFDGGVDTSSGSPGPYFPIVAADLTSEPPSPGDIDHGTAVTGAVLYGLVGPGQQAPEIPLPVESFRVLPAPPPVPGDLYGYWILDQVLDVVERGDHKIVNLSLGPELAVEDGSLPNRWTSELDRLAWEYDVLFVVAAGNTGLAPAHVGLNRVQVPADMVNGLAVGACDTAAPGKPWARSAYSSIGPGRAGCRAQPVGLQFGGAAETTLFPLLKTSGSFLEASGTSFSAPVHTHALAELTTQLPQANPSVLRAFSVHFADRPATSHKKLFPEVGHGRLPLTFADVLDCTPDDVHVLYVDEISRGELLGYQLPVPIGATGNTELRITLAYSTPVEPTQPTEYTQSSIEMVLRPHALTYGFTSTDPTDTRQVANITSPQGKQLLADGWRPSQDPVSKSLQATGKSELDLRDAGKWETLRHYRVNFVAGDLHSPRLDISYLARRTGKLQSSSPSIPFAVILTVIDKDKSGALFDRASTEFGALRVLPRDRARIRVRAGDTPTWK